MNYPNDMDPDCVPLCDALNNMMGIETSESCAGHGKRPFRVHFSAQDVNDLRPLLEAIDDDRDGTWTVGAHWASGSDNIYFTLSGPFDSAWAHRLAARLSFAKSEDAELAK